LEGAITQDFSGQQVGEILKRKKATIKQARHWPPIVMMRSWYWSQFLEKRDYITAAPAAYSNRTEEQTMEASPAMLRTVDRLEITILMDNSIDGLLPDTEEIQRQARRPSTLPWGERQSLIAEHGFSALVRVHTAGHESTLLFDAGVSTHGLMHNMDVLEIDPQDLQGIILSHGHLDHTQGLLGLFERVQTKRLPIVLHPDALLNRKAVYPDGKEFQMPALDRRRLEQQGAEIIEARGPSYLAEGLVLVTGEIPRTTDFEQGMPIQYAEIDGAWQADPLVHDDQALVFHVQNKGLVVLTGCSHAGAINIIRYAQELTGIKTIYALLGGLHLSGRLFEARIPPTVEALRAMAPRLIIPGHCTGWEATHLLARELPEAFVQSSVGTCIVIEGGTAV
jgi:7,8-dihydropterin-6-yl-methyl-4-(beta-D-ribofuranosyl)aminobenzene 5'-phosphate synthase